MRKLIIFTFIIALALGSLLLYGCGYEGEKDANLPPSLVLNNNPSDGDTLGAAPIIYWQGFDRDGKVYEYEYIDLPREQIGSSGGVEDSLYQMYAANPTLLGSESHVLNQSGDTISWELVESNSDTIFLSLLVEDEVTEHLFCVRALDQRGAASEVECRTYFRSNIPPDSLVITTDPFDGEEFWCLDDTTYSWDGIDVSWTGADPDNSILLEYKWRLEDSTGTTILSSLFEDSLGGVNSGFDDNDGWIRSTSSQLRGPVPTGDYTFIIEIRDDAFYVGKADTANIGIAHPEYDISREEVREQYADGTYPDHRILLIDQNNSFLYPPDLGEVRSFYEGVFDDLVSDGMIAGYSTAISGYGDLEVDKSELAQYNILYVLDQDPGATFKMSEDFLEELMQYVKIGGRIIIDGRNVFANENPDWTEQPSYSYFGIAEDFIGPTRTIFDEAIEHLSGTEYPGLVVDPDKAEDSELNYVNRLGARTPSYGGSPYTQIIYKYGVGESATPADSNDYQQGPVAVRYVTPSFRTAYFAFPLYLMENDEGQVDTVIESTVDFIKQQVLPPDTTDTGS